MRTNTGPAATAEGREVRSGADREPYRRGRESRTQRVLNGVMRGLLRSPMHSVVSGRVAELTIVGRRTGHTYRLPVGYVCHGDALLVGTVGTWRRNLRPDDPITVLLRGRHLTATAEVITDERRCTELYRVILARNPVHGRYAKIATTADGGPDPDDLHRALARGAAVVRLTPTGRC